jgi:hypothetical protein
MEHIRQSRPDSGLGLQVKVPKPFKLFPLCSAAVRAKCTRAGGGGARLGDGGREGGGTPGQRWSIGGGGTWATAVDGG